MRCRCVYYCVYYMDMRRCFFRWPLFIWMLVVVPGFAQAPSAAQKKAAPTLAPSKWPIATLAVEGTHNFSREQVLAIAGVKVGQVAGKADFEAARDRLTACGAFETVGYKFVPGSGGGYDATFQVAEVEQVYPVRFEELHVSERDLIAALKAKDPLFAKGTLPATQPVFERYTKWVEEYLKAKGTEEKMVGTVMPDRGEYTIVFYPARALPAVAMVTFEGNRVLTQEVLKDAIMSVAVGTPYTEDRFRELLNSAVRPVYEARGRVRVSFPAIKSEPSKDVQGVNVTVRVDEGETYNLGTVTVEQPTPIAPEVLLKTGDFKTGDLANFDKVNEGLERIRKALRHAGYMSPTVTYQRKVNEEKHLVDLAVLVEAGARFSMRKLTIVGLDLDAEAEINRIWTMKPGNPFNPDYPELFLTRIKEEGLFDNLGKTKADTRINEQDHTADVTLTFSGGKPETKPGGRGRGGRGGDLLTERSQSGRF
jgi:outer membrane protein insertion porin family